MIGGPVLSYDLPDVKVELEKLEKDTTRQAELLKLVNVFQEGVAKVLLELKRNQRDDKQKLETE